MESQFSEVTSEDELDKVFAESEDAPVLLYLHDPYCGLSRIAHAEVTQLGLRVAWIDVHARHDLGMDVERLTGVRHESPQTLILRNRQAKWVASHRKVTGAFIVAALEASTEGGPTTPPSKSPRGLWWPLRSLVSGVRRPL